MLIVLFLLSRKKNTSTAIRLYQEGICRPHGHQLKYLRSDPDSTIGMEWLNKINEDLDQPLQILAPLSPKVMAEHQRQHGISVNKTATEQHERMVERHIQTLQNDAINAMMSQNNLPAHLYGYALMNAGERMNAMIGRQETTRLILGFGGDIQKKKNTKNTHTHFSPKFGSVLPQLPPTF